MENKSDAKSNEMNEMVVCVGSILEVLAIATRRIEVLIVRLLTC